MKKVDSFQNMTKLSSLFQLFTEKVTIVEHRHLFTELLFYTSHRECSDKVEEQRALATLGATYLAQCECEQTLKGKRNAYKLAEEAFIKGLEAAEEIKATLKEVDYNDMKGRLFQNLGRLGPYFHGVIQI